MTDLTPITPFGDTAASVEQIGGFTLHERPDHALATLALLRGQPKPAPFGLGLPGPGQAVWQGGYGAFWIGPDQWMIEAEAHPDLAQDLMLDLPGHAVTDQSDGFVTLDLMAEGAPYAMTSLMGKLINLDPRALGPGCATRTLLDHMAVFVIRRTEGTMTLIGMRSYAGSLWHAVTRAMAQAAARHGKH